MNNTTSNSSYDDYASYISDSFTVVVIKEIAFALVGMVALMGNSLVIAAVLQTRRMRTITNYLIVNMAVVDIFYTLIAMPQMVLLIADYQWSSESLFFEFFCKASNFSTFMLQADSVLTLAVIATDRYFAIMMPLKKMLTKRVFWVALVFIWVTSVLVASPILYTFRVFTMEDGFVYCAEEWEPLFDGKVASKIYTVLLFVVVYCIPFVAMTIAYCVICNKLWTRKVIGELNQSGKKILESRKKVVKMLVTVLVVFVLCWLPVQVVSLWAFFDDKMPVIPRSLDFLCYFVMHAHPALNPCIYVVFSQNFRDGFKMAIRCYWCRGERAGFMGKPMVTKKEVTLLSKGLGDPNELHGDQSTGESMC